MATTKLIPRKFLFKNIPYSADVSSFTRFLGLNDLDNAVKLLYDDKGRSLGQAVVEIPDNQSDHIQTFDNQIFKGRKLRLVECSERTLKENKGMSAPVRKDQEWKVPYLYNLVDIGVNLTHRWFQKDLSSVLEKALGTGVTKMIVTGTSKKESQAAKALADRYPGTLYYTTGVHPHNAKECDTNKTYLTEIENLASHNGCVAIGECGLDFNRNFSPKEKQISIFEDQVKLACKLQKPLFCHEREAFTEFMSVVGKYKGSLPPLVVHCFTGKQSEAKEYLSQGFYIGLTGFLAKDRSNDSIRSMLIDDKTELLLDRLMLETDAPFMKPNLKSAPRDFQMKCDGKLSKETIEIEKFHIEGRRNEPCLLPYVTELIAAHLGISPQELASRTTANATRFFNL